MTTRSSERVRGREGPGKLEHFGAAEGEEGTTLTTPAERVTQMDAVSRVCPVSASANQDSPVPPRRKRRSAEVRNSLRLFGLLAVLAGVNVYVFFFNHGTAPREVLKPSSTVKGGAGEGQGKAEMLREATLQANAALAPAAIPAEPVPASSAREGASRPPVPLGPASGSPGAKTAARVAVAPGGAPPKASPGGSPGQDHETPRNQAGSPSARPEVSRSASQSASQSESQSASQSASPEHCSEKKFSDSDTLGQVLAREGFDKQAGKVVAALSRLLDPKSIRGGQSYTVRLDELGDPVSFEYRPSPVTRFVATPAPDGGGSWIATRVDHAVETRIVAVAGTVDATLYESIQGAGEGSALAGLLVELLAWDVNFYIDSHPGDHWKVIVEKQYLGEQFYRYGHVLAAEYGGSVGTFRSFYWKPCCSTGEGRYFDEKGQAISKTMLKTPLRYVRVSSRFDRHRFHPILHREKAHLGIDYAAPVGTPVWASSSGKVLECEMKRGSGNTVVIAHGNGMTTRYYHLSRFARGLKAGQSVRQKEVIGFVGTTGLSTGPHLHFSVTKGGAFVDPSKVQVNRDAPVSDRSAYLAAIRSRLTTLRALEPGTLARN